VDHLNSLESGILMQRSKDLPLSGKLRLLANLNSSIVPTVGLIQDPEVTPLGSFDTRSDVNFQLYRIDKTLPRAYFAANVIPAADRGKALEYLLASESVLSDTVILETPVNIPTEITSVNPGVVRISRYENTQVECRVESKSSGYLVLLDSWYPGWKAYLDGKETGILRANYAFRAVAVGPGTHQVVFIYKPASFYLGAAISIATLFIGLSIAVVSYFRKKKQAPGNKKRDNGNLTKVIPALQQKPHQG